MMNHPDSEVQRVERLVEPSDINPEDRSGSGLMLLAPWELMVIEKSSGEDRYGVHWCCPRCLDPGSLASHAVELKGHGVMAAADQEQPLQMSDQKLDLLKQADPEDFQATVNPSIGCRCCGFHCYLEQSGYRVLSDWQEGRDSSRDPEQVFGNRLGKLHEHRPDAYQRLAEAVEG